MTKTQTKFYYLSIFLLSLIAFIFFLIIYFFSFVSISIYPKIIIIYALSLLLAAIITHAYTLTSSAISDAMTTLRRLSRAENLSNPLLLRLSTEAPGTYHHSMNVSNLAQRAAKIIGADSLLVRVASYYHDIGKLSEPKVFVENQSQNEIPDEENGAWIRNNAKKILSHVGNGCKIAKDAGLPPEIIDIIAQHHGDTKALYFFERAKERGLKIKKTDFSYPGPKPQSKEAAIVMLADCVEASARAQKDINKESINSLVRNIIEEKYKEGQLDFANFTDMEIIKIKESLSETLLTIYHQRISYDSEHAHNRV